MKRLTSMAFAALLVAALCATAFAQGTSSLTGTVTDPNGAVVSGATVTATNVATNVSTTTQTTDNGLYRFPTLPVGNYTIKVEASGFSTAQLEQVVLTVAQVVTQDIKLAVGSASETVTVVAGGEQLAQPSASTASTTTTRGRAAAARSSPAASPASRPRPSRSTASSPTTTRRSTARAAGS